MPTRPAPRPRCGRFARLCLLMLTTAALAAACGSSDTPAAGAATGVARSAAPGSFEPTALSDPDWPQWGGPTRDFRAPAGDLAAGWPADGPPQLWRRELGEGYSAIAAVDGVLYTTLHRQGSEVVVALDADSGETLWEHAYEVSMRGMNTEQGRGPHTTPLIVGDRVFVAGATGQLRALRRDDGSPLWSHDLWTEYGGTRRDRGYSSSPIAHGDTVIALVGGQGSAAMAFDMADGSVVWQGGDFGNGQASPVLIDLDGAPQLVGFMEGDVAGFDPSTGEVLWSVPHRTNYGLNISTPVWGSDDVLFVSSAYSGGSRAIRLRPAADGVQAEELWFSSRLRVHFGTAMRIGDRVYGSSGDFGPSFFVAMDLPSGEVAWQDRGFAKASFLLAGELLVLLDEDGTLALVSPGERGLEVRARSQIFDSLSWTVPTLVGERLYARNRREIVALDLGA